jgi:hypothetical protein
MKISHIFLVGFFSSLLAGLVLYYYLKDGKAAL